MAKEGHEIVSDECQMGVRWCPMGGVAEEVQQWREAGTGRDLQRRGRGALVCSVCTVEGLGK